jgi:hypothetical protein
MCTVIAYFSGSVMTNSGARHEFENYLRRLCQAPVNVAGRLD